jgi:dTDP-glucose 4,6-dehydratase
MQRLLVTGGAGFIGSAFVRFLLKRSDFSGRIVTLDVLNYASDLSLLEDLDERRHRFVRGDILDRELVERLLVEEKIETVVHFAAQTHVDRSIASAAPFFETNVGGTLVLLEAIRAVAKEAHFHHVSTDEVYGSLGKEGFFR